MVDEASTSQQRFAQDFDPDRFRAQLNWLIEHHRIWENGRWVKRTVSTIVRQLNSQHPGFHITTAHFYNLISGRKHAIVSLQLAQYLCQMFGVQFDFFLDPDSDRQRANFLQSGNVLQIQRPPIRETEDEATDDNAATSLALRGSPAPDQATLAQLRQVQDAGGETGELLTFLHSLTEGQRRLLETLLAVPTVDIGSLEVFLRLQAQSGELSILENLRTLPSAQRKAIERLIQESVSLGQTGRNTKAKPSKGQA